MIFTVFVKPDKGFAPIFVVTKEGDVLTAIEDKPPGVMPGFPSAEISLRLKNNAFASIETLSEDISVFFAIRLKDEILKRYYEEI